MLEFRKNKFIKYHIIRLNALQSYHSIEKILLKYNSSLDSSIKLLILEVTSIIVHVLPNFELYTRDNNNSINSKMSFWYSVVRKLKGNLKQIIGDINRM